MYGLLIYMPTLHLTTIIPDISVVNSSKKINQSLSAHSFPRSKNLNMHGSHSNEERKNKLKPFFLSFSSKYQCSVGAIHSFDKRNTSGICKTQG